MLSKEGSCVFVVSEFIAEARPNNLGYMCMSRYGCRHTICILMCVAVIVVHKLCVFESIDMFEVYIMSKNVWDASLGICVA